MCQKGTKTTQLSRAQYIQQRNYKISSIKKASYLVDEVTTNLCSMIINGDLDITSQQKSLPTSPVKKNQINIKIVRSSSPSIAVPDPDKHKQLIKKFMREHRRLKRRRQMHSIQLQQNSLKKIQLLQKSKQQNKTIAIQTRRSQIEKRMKQKQNLLKQIQKSTLEQNSRIKQISKKKFLYKQKQQQFTKKFVIPKIKESETILKFRKQTMKPIDMTQLKNHQLKYKNSLMQQAFSRANNSKMNATQWKQYSPPSFIPKSYRLLEGQKQYKQVQQQLKKQQHQINSLKMKKFVDEIKELHEEQWQRQIKKKQSLDRKSPSLKQQKVVLLSRQEKNNIGNKYMSQIFKTIDKSKHKQKKLITYEDQEKYPKKKVKSLYELQLVRQERIQKIERIRIKRIDEIISNDKDNNVQKFQRLKQQAERLDDMFAKKQKSKKKGLNICDLDESASLILNSIQAKIAMLDIAQPEQNEQ